MKPQKYKVRLSGAERTQLEGILQQGTSTKKQITRAKILLEQDDFYYWRSNSRTQDIVASRCNVSTTTVYNVSKQYVEEGLQAAIDRKVREKPPIAPTVTDEKEAELIALAGSEAPDGYSRWTLRLLEEKAMELRIVERISDTTIGRILKKHQIQLNHTLNDALKTKQTCKRHSL